MPTALILAGVAVAFLGCLGRASVRPPAESPRPGPVERERAEKFGSSESVAVENIANEDAGPAPRETGAPPPVYHPLESGMTLYSLARAYEVPLDLLLRANGITDPTKVSVGTPILIPGAARRLVVALPGEAVPRASAPPAAVREPRGRPSSSDRFKDIPAFLWPLRGTITSSFGARGKHRHHEGVDIDGDSGDAILAAAAGTVLRADSEGQYGRLVVIDHGRGVTTLYAHASRLHVRPGDRVEQGDLIAEVGRSGNARGTHLHFEVRRDGRALDPLPLLERGLLIAGRRGKHSPPAAASVMPSR